MTHTHRWQTSGLGKVNVPVQRRRASAVRCNRRLLGITVPLAPEYNMGGFLRRNELNAFVSQSAHVNPLEQSLSPPSRTGEIATCSSVAAIRHVQLVCTIFIASQPLPIGEPLARMASP
jgi:hypothetical protein